MILEVTGEQAAARRQQYTTPGGAPTYVNTYMGTNKMELLAQGRTETPGTSAGAEYPMAYLVEQGAGSTVDPHYHAVDQFQLFVGGEGRIGTHALEGVTVHYAGAHSPYGPIVAGPNGVQYMTLRRSWDPGGQWMPAAAPALRALPNRRHLTFTSEPLMRTRDLRGLHAVSVHTVLAPEAEGPGAWLVQAGPGAPVRAAESAGGDMFWYVLAGSLRSPAGQLGPGACVYCSATEEGLERTAGDEGVELVQVRFSRPKIGGEDS